MIEVEKLSKTYTVHKKEPGLKGPIRALFTREAVEKHALREVDLRVGDSVPARIFFGEDRGRLVPLMFGVTAAFGLVLAFLWKRGLRAYSSASS